MPILPIEYVQGSMDSIIIANWDNLFVNADPTACPIGSCTLFNPNNLITLEVSSTWSINAPKNIFSPTTINGLKMTCTTSGTSVINVDSDPFDLQF